MRTMMGGPANRGKVLAAGGTCGSILRSDPPMGPNPARGEWAVCERSTDMYSSWVVGPKEELPEWAQAHIEAREHVEAHYAAIAAELDASRQAREAASAASRAAAPYKAELARATRRGQRGEIHARARRAGISL